MIRKANPEDLEAWFEEIPLNLVPQFPEINGTDENYATIPFFQRLSLLVWVASGYTQVPKTLQLKAALAFLYEKDSLLIAGTGFGKTMLVVMAVLLADPDDEMKFITVTPLKRLQESQSHSFLEKYGIPTLAINEDTMASMSDETWRASCTRLVKNMVQEVESTKDCQEASSYTEIPRQIPIWQELVPAKARLGMIRNRLRQKNGGSHQSLYRGSPSQISRPHRGTGYESRNV